MIPPAVPVFTPDPTVTRAAPLANAYIQHERLEAAALTLQGGHDNDAHHVLTAILAGLHALRAAQEGRLPPDVLQLTLDVCATADSGTDGLSTLAATLLGHLVREPGGLAGLGVHTPGVTLTPTETRQAARALLPHLNLAQPASDHDAPGLLETLLEDHPHDQGQPPAALHARPDRPEIRDLPVREDPAHAAELSILRALQGQARTEEGRAAAALARLAVSRANYRHLPVRRLLNTALGLTDLADRQGEGRDVTRSVTAQVWTLTRALRCRLPDHPRPGLSAPAHTRAHLLSAARHALRRAENEHTAPAQEGFSGTNLWKIFDALDITSDLDVPDAHRDLTWVVQQFATIETLLHHRRAPGMPLADLAEIAAALGGFPDDWAWTYEPTGLIVEGVSHGALGLILLDVLRTEQAQVIIHGLEQDLPAEARPPRPTLPAAYPEFRRTALTLCAQKLAELNAAGLRVPQHTRLTDALNRLGPVPAALPPASERLALLHRGIDLSEHLSATTAEFITHMDRLIEQLQELEGQGDGPEHHAGDAVQPAVNPAPLAAPLAVRSGTARAPGPSPGMSRREPAHVWDARALLTGRTMVMLGGVVKPSHVENFERTLGVQVHWQSGDAYVHGAHLPIPAGAALIVLPVRFMSHEHFWGLKDAAVRSGIPFVVHPGGLNPSSVAASVMQQCSDRLRACT